MAKAERYIPPLSYDWLTPLFDRVIPLVMPEIALKRRLIEQAHVQSGHRVLDLGAGTGTLTIMIKQAYPASDVIGLDGDRRVLDIAQAKAAAARVTIRLDHGFATDLPYDDRTFDRVFSSLMLHHLATRDKLLALGEVWRVLRPGGEVHILDFGKPHSLPAYLTSLVMRHLEEVEDNVRGRLPEMLRAAGFAGAAETEHRLSLLGTLSLYRARKEA